MKTRDVIEMYDALVNGLSKRELPGELAHRVMIMIDGLSPTVKNFMDARDSCSHAEIEALLDVDAPLRLPTLKPEMFYGTTISPALLKKIT